MTYCIGINRGLFLQYKQGKSTIKILEKDVDRIVLYYSEVNDDYGGNPVGGSLLHSYRGKPYLSSDSLAAKCLPKQDEGKGRKTFQFLFACHVQKLRQSAWRQHSSL